MELWINIAALLGVIFLALIAAKSTKWLIEKLQGGSSSIPFDSIMEKINLPIITVTDKEGNKKLNFLVDSGAAFCVVSSQHLDKLEHKLLEIEGVCYGMEGNVTSSSAYAEIPFSYKGTVYKDNFQVLDMSKPFGKIESDFGITLHGILGCSFLSMYGCTIDFDDMSLQPSHGR